MAGWLAGSFGITTCLLVHSYIHTYGRTDGRTDGHTNKRDLCTQSNFFVSEAKHGKVGLAAAIAAPSFLHRSFSLSKEEKINTFRAVASIVLPT